MTTDARITEDLAVVGRTSQLRPIELEATLRAVGAVAGDERPAVVPLIYVARCARAWSGAAAVIAVAALIAHLFVPVDHAGNGLSSLIWIPKFWVGVAVLGLVFGAHVLGGWLATRRILRDRLDGPTLRLRALRVRRVSVTASIAGVTSFIVCFGLLQAALGAEVIVPMVPQVNSVVDLAYHSHWVRPMTVMLVCAFVATLLGSIAVGRLSSMRGLVVGVVVLIATSGVGLIFDAGPMVEAFLHHRSISVPLRAVLTATGTIGLFLTVAGIVFRVHGREDALLR